MPSATAPASTLRYAIAVAITLAAVLSQYVLPENLPIARPLYGTLAGDLAIVYGLPVVSFLLLVGTGPLRGAFANLPRAALEGLRWFGLLSLLAVLVTLLMAVVYLLLDPSALELLARPNPQLTSAAADPWLWIALSFVAGAFEELLFRGWIFGYLVQVDERRWPLHAVWTSALFASVHLYYGATYGIASGLLFPSLFFLGLAFALAFRYSGGNLLVISLLHGAFDAISFLSLLNLALSEGLHVGLVLAGLVVAVALYRLGPRRLVRPGGAAYP